MADLLDPPSWRIPGTADLIQQIATLVWLHKGDEAKDLYKTVTGARVAYELYNRVFADQLLEQYQAQCILSIVGYIQKNPRASEADLVKELTKQIEIFRQNVDSM